MKLLLVTIFLISLLSITAKAQGDFAFKVNSISFCSDEEGFPVEIAVLYDLGFLMVKDVSSEANKNNIFYSKIDFYHYKESIYYSYGNADYTVLVDLKTKFLTIKNNKKNTCFEYSAKSFLEK